MTGSLGGAAKIVEVLSRRAAMDIIGVLTSGALGERALTTRLSAYNSSVVTQRVEDLRRIEVVELVPENGDLRLSARGRRLLGVLDGLGAWAADLR
ncbi:MAG: transcriptional regulator [Actinomycetota bacterium]